jgi:hypothetical protein
VNLGVREGSRTINHAINTSEERRLEEWKSEQTQDNLTLVDNLRDWGE